AIIFRLGRVVQHVDYARATNARRVVYAGLGKVVVIAKLLGASLREELHVVLTAEMQAPSGARFDACRLQPFAHPVGAECALIDALGFRIKFRDVERASGDAITAADAMLLLKIDDAVGVLDDGSIGRARVETSRVGAVHAL